MEEIASKSKLVDVIHHKGKRYYKINTIHLSQLESDIVALSIEPDEVISTKPAKAMNIIEQTEKYEEKKAEQNTNEPSRVESKIRNEPIGNTRPTISRYLL